MSGLINGTTSLIIQVISYKKEEIYFKTYNKVKKTKQTNAEKLDFYNMIRPHSSLNKAKPNEFYDQHLLKEMEE